MTMLDEALAYAEKGWYVFPCWEKEREVTDLNGNPVVLGAKRPYTGNGLHDATLEVEQIKAWWTKWSDALIGINCEKSNLFVIDLDVKSADGIENFKKLNIEHSGKAFHSKTPSGGWHVIFTGTGPSTTNGATGIDTRGKGGYFIAPPSEIKNGKYPGAYQQLRSEDWSSLPAMVTQDILDKLSVEKTYGSYAGQSTNYNRNGEKRQLSKASQNYIFQGAPNGSRNATLFKVLADFVGCGYNPNETRDILLSKTLEIGLDAGEFEETMRKAFSKPRTSSIPDEIQQKISTSRNPATILSDTESHIVEEALLSVLIKNNNLIAYAFDFLLASDFDNLKNREIFKIISKLYEDDLRVDSITIADRLPRGVSEDDLNRIIAEYDIDPVGLKTYVTIIKEKSAIRKLKILMDRGDDILSSGKPLLEMVGTVEKELANIAIASGVRTTAVLDGEAAVDMVTERTKAVLNGDIVPLQTGFTDFDRKTGGLYPNDLLMLVARPGEGKSAMALSIMKTIAIERKESVLGFFLEASTHETICRLICQLTGIPFSAVFRGDLNEREWLQYNTALDQIKAGKLLFDDTSGITIPELRAKIRQAKNDTDLKLVVIDQLEQIRAYETLNTNIQYDKIAYDVKMMAKEFNVPIILLHQLNRAVTDRKLKNAEPQLSDLNQAGEKPVNQVWAIIHTKDELDNIISSRIKCLKNRNGPKVNFNVQFLPERMLFVNSTKQYDERSSYLVDNDDDYDETEEQDPYAFSPKWAK